MRADDGTSAAAMLQVQFGAGPLINRLNRHIQLYVSNLAFPPGGRFSNIRTSAMQTVVGNAKAASIIRTDSFTLIKLKRSYNGQII